MKIYLAAKLPAQQDVANFASDLVRGGKHEVTDAWWDRAWQPVKPEAHKELAQELLEAIREAEALIIIPPDEGGVGCFIEFGYALALDKGIHVLQKTGFSSSWDRWNPIHHKRHSSFFHLDDSVRIWDDPADLLKHLSQG